MDRSGTKSLPVAGKGRGHKLASDIRELMLCLSRMLFARKSAHLAPSLPSSAPLLASAEEITKAVAWST